VLDGLGRANFVQPLGEGAMTAPRPKIITATTKVQK
jgi:hypothetical protein